MVSAAIEGLRLVNMINNISVRGGAWLDREGAGGAYEQSSQPLNKIMLTKLEIFAERVPSVSLVSIHGSPASLDTCDTF